MTAEVASRSLDRIVPAKRLRSRMNLLRYLNRPVSQRPPQTRARSARRRFQPVFCGGILTVLCTSVVWAEPAFVPSPVTKGLLLVASPSLNDPNFHHTVLLLIKHGSEGTLGLVLNRSTQVRLSQVLPNLTGLHGTDHRLFTGGPVEPTRLLLLFRMQAPPADARPVIDGLFVGGTPALLERVINQPRPNEVFRAFAGYAGWGPGQLESEMLQGAWGVLSPEGVDLFTNDPAALWPDSIARLQAPRVISR